MDYLQIANYCKSHWEGQCNHVIRIANEVIQNTFVFDLPWDMEQCKVPYTFEKEIDWNFYPKDDPEWMYMLSRNAYISCLAKAYVLTQEESYRAYAINIIEDFIDHNPLTVERKATSWRTIDTAIRCEHWILAVEIFHQMNPLEASFLAKFKESLQIQGEYLVEEHNSFRRLSNWGVIGCAGLYAIGTYLKNIEFIQTAVARVEENISFQILEDGFHWEQSPMYHNEVGISIMSILINSRGQWPVPQNGLWAVEKMTYANFYSKMPNHLQLAQSDSDCTDLRDVITRGAYLCQDAVLKFGGYAMLDFDSAWICGEKAIQVYDKLEVQEPLETSIELGTSGNYYLRSGWGEDDSYCHFRCGAIGSGHGHADLLHVDLFAKGKSILVDSGRYTYVNKEERKRLKAPSAHNTTVIDQVEFTTCVDSWAFGTCARYSQSPMVERGGYVMAQGTNLGYLSLPNGGIVHNRKVLMLDPELFVLVDVYGGIGTHNYHQYYHCNSNAKVEVKNQQAILEIDDLQVQVAMLGDGIKGVVSEELYSPHYNELKTAPTLDFSWSGDGFQCVYTVISIGKPLKSLQKLEVNYVSDRTTVTEENASAIEIKKQDGTNYIVQIGHRDHLPKVDLVRAGNLECYGKVVVQKEYLAHEKQVVLEV